MLNFTEIRHYSINARSLTEIREKEIHDTIERTKQYPMW